MKRTPPLLCHLARLHHRTHDHHHHIEHQSVSHGLTTLTMKQVSRSSGSSVLQAASYIATTTAANPTTYRAIVRFWMGLQYYYKVCATNSAGDSAYSNEVNGITFLEIPSTLTATAVSSSEIDLTWTGRLLRVKMVIESSKALLMIYTYVEIYVTWPNVTSYMRQV